MSDVIKKQGPQLAVGQRWQNLDSEKVYVILHFCEYRCTDRFEHVSGVVYVEEKTWRVHACAVADWPSAYWPLPQRRRVSEL